MFQLYRLPFYLLSSVGHPSEQPAHVLNSFSVVSTFDLKVF